jgi:hypothetical protein
MGLFLFVDSIVVFLSCFFGLLLKLRVYIATPVPGSGLVSLVGICLVELC